MSQSWSRAVLDISVAYDSDVERVSAVMREVAAALSVEEPWSGLVLEDPEVLGVERVAGDAVVIRLVQKTRPGEQWKVARELRQRIKQRFDDEGIVMPLPVVPRATGQQ
jgi:small conductance mechanosensitive channel